MLQQHYRDHVIRYEATQTPGTPHWVGKADVNFHQHGSWRIVPLKGPLSRFETEEEAEKYILQIARKWIDDHPKV